MYIKSTISIFIILNSLFLIFYQPLSITTSPEIKNIAAVIVSFILHILSSIGYLRFLRCKLSKFCDQVTPFLFFGFIIFESLFAVSTSYYSPSPSFLIFYKLIGCLFFVKNFDLQNDLKNNFLRWKQLSPLEVILFLFVFFMSFYLHESRDPYLYHLTYSLKVSGLGPMFFSNKNPLLVQSSYFEFLNIIPAILFHRDQNIGFYEVQIFSQLSHFFFGFCFSWVALKKLGQKFNFNQQVTGLIIVICLMDQTVFWTSWLAKNDYYALFCVLTGLCFLLDFQKHKEAAIFFGLAAGGKFTMFFSTFPLVIYEVVNLKHSRKKIATFLTFFSLIILIILTRNFSLTQNPVFPSFSDYFSNQNLLSQSWLIVQKSLEGKSLHQISHLGISLLKIFQENWLVFFGHVIILLNLYLNKINKKYFLICACIIPFYAYVFQTPDAATSSVQLRLISPSLILAQFFGLHLFFDWNKNFIKHKLQLFILYLIILSIFPYSLISFIKDHYQVTSGFETHKNSDCQFWIITNIDSKSRILGLGRDQYFLYSDKNFSVLYHDQEVDNLLHQSKNSDQFLTDLRKIEVSYLFLERLERPQFYQMPNMALYKYYLNNSASIKYRGIECLIIKL